ncbi:cobalt ABC transporter permease, partial [Klebsiella pneumoniae]|nr:cobalt ABC transporter permease [Klebsiella pneumoniae]
EHAQLKNSYRTFYISKKTKLIYLLFFLLLQTSLFL